MSEVNNAAPEAVNADVQADSDVQPEQQAAPTTPKLSRKMKVKVDGEEFEENLPFEYDESNKEQVEYLKRHLQMSKAANKRMSESAQTRKQAEALIQALRENPIEVLSNEKLMGTKKFREIAEQFLANELQNEMLSPQEKHQRDMERKLKEYESKEKQAQEQAEMQRRSQIEQHYAQEFEKTIVTALQTSDLPKNPFTVRRMAELMQKNIKHGFEIPPEHLARLVKEDYQREVMSLISNSDAKQILGMFGEDVVNKIRKHDLEQLKQRPVGSGRSESSSNYQQEEKPSRYLRPDEFNRMIDERLKRK